MKSDSVWVSSVKSDSTLVRSLSVDRSEPGWAALKEGRVPSGDELPLNAFAKNRDDRLKNLPPLFQGGGGITVTSALAAPMLKFDLGRTLLLPMRIFLADRKTEVGAERGFFTIPRYEVFEALAPEASPELQPDRYSNPPTHWALPWTPKDGDVAVHAKALDGPAMWHDPKLFNGTFLSGALVAAMQEAGVARYWQLTRCRVV